MDWMKVQMAVEARYDDWLRAHRAFDEYNRFSDFQMMCVETDKVKSILDEIAAEANITRQAAENFLTGYARAMGDI